MALKEQADMVEEVEVEGSLVPFVHKTGPEGHYIEDTQIAIGYGARTATRRISETHWTAKVAPVHG